MQYADIRPPQIEDGDIGTFSNLERSDFFLQPERFGSVDRRHFQRTFDRHACGIEMPYMLHQHASLHLFDHIDGVIHHWPAVPSATLTPARTALAAGVMPPPRIASLVGV